MEPETLDREQPVVWLRYVAIGVLATFILVGLKLIVEHTDTGKENELWVFGKLQSSLWPIDLDNPVVVLDISSLPGGKVGDPTPRKSLEEIISTLAELQPQPRAIAVDIDFSPRGTNYSATDDEHFFDFCLSVTRTKKVPVFLAVGETKSAPPEAWLGSELYKELAVAAAANIKDTTHIPLWVKSSQSAEKLKMLNYALAREYRKQLPRASSWIERLVETPGAEPDEAFLHETTIEGDANLVYENSVVNYSKLDQMRLVASRDVSAAAIKQNSDRYSQKLVILGDLSSADKVPVPGRSVDEPGSLVLASATYTLTREPLYEFKWWVRLSLDFLIAGSIILAVTSIRRRSPDGSWVGKQALFVYVAILVVFITGWKLVAWAGILWLDFPLVALALFLHPKTEHFIDRVLAKLTQRSVPVAAKTAGVVLALLVMSGQLSAQEGLVLPAPCEKSVAAVGLRLSTPKSATKRKKVGTCYVRDNRESPWQALTASGVKRQYRAGQHITCDPGCSVTLYICGTGTEEPVNKRLPDWFPVFHAYRAPPLKDTHPNNLLRKARLFSPPDPILDEDRGRRIGRRFSGFGALVGAISTGRVSVAAPSGEKKSESTENKEKEKEKEKVAAAVAGLEEAARRNTPAAKPTGNESSSAADTLKQFLESLDKGTHARQKGDYALARESYLAAQKTRPEDYRGFQGLGNVFADEKNWGAAELEYRKALMLESLNSQLNLSLAFVLLQTMGVKGDYSKVGEVEELLLIASASRPNNENIYALYEQLIEFQAPDLATAEKLFRRAVMYAPGSPRANLRLASVLYRSDRPEEALDYVQRAEKYADGEQLLAVAKMYESHGRYKDAERVLKTALKSMPNNSTVLYSLGSVMLQRKHYGSALNVLQTTVELDPTSFAPAFAYSIARFGKGDLAGAEISLDQASQKVGENADGRQRLAYWFSALGDAYSGKRKVADAIRVYEKSILYAENSEVRDKLWEMKQKRDSKQKRSSESP